MVRPPDIPKYFTHNVSKRHSLTVTPFVAAPGPLVFNDIMRSEMEAAWDLMGMEDSSSIEWVDILLAKLNQMYVRFLKKIFTFIPFKKKIEPFKKKYVPLVL